MTATGTASGSRRIVLAVVAATILGSVVWWLGQIGDQAVAEHFCRTLAHGVAQGDAADLVGLLDESYDFEAHWPQVGRLRLAKPGPERHQQIRQLLARWFFTRRGEERSLIWHLDTVTAQSDGDADLIATVTLSIASDRSDRLLPEQTITFRLRRNGSLSRGVHIITHDPVSITAIR